MKIGDLFLQLGIKADIGTINKINDGFKTMRRTVIEVQIAFAAALYGLDKFVSGTVQGVASLENLNQQTGLSIDLIQKWQQAGQKSNLSLTADSIANSIANLQKNIAAIHLGQGNVSPFQLLGIDINNRDAFGVLEQLRNNIKGLPNDIASNLISQLGLDPNFISVLRLSNEEFEKLGQNSFLGKSGRASVMATGFAIKDLKLKLQQLKDQAVAKLAPALTELITKFFSWIERNSGKVIKTILSVAEAIKRFTVAIGNAISLAQTFVENTLGIENGIKALALGFGALALSFRPVLLGLFLIIGLFDDIKVWSQGGKSLFGDFYKAISGLGKTFAPLKNLFNGFKETISSAFNFDEKTEKNLDKINKFFTGAKEVLQGAGIGAILGFLTGGAGGAIKGALAFGGADIFAQIVGWQKQLLDQYGTKRVAGEIVDHGTFNQAKKQIEENKKNVNNNISVQVYGMSEPKQTAIEIENQLKNAQTILNNGGKF